MFSSIPHQRLVFYALFLGLVPILLATMSVVTDVWSLGDLERDLESTEHQIFIKEKKQALNNSLRNYFRDADHFYIDKHLENLAFLESETEHLQKMIDGTLPVSESIRKRHEFLTSSHNSLAFAEGQVHAFAHFQETTETMLHPVEVNILDIQKILSKVEGVEIGPFTPGPYRPHLIITEFKIEKKAPQPDNEVFLLNMKLLKREYL